MTKHVLSPDPGLLELAEQVPLIDGHCHAFAADREEGSLARQFSISEDALPEKHLRETVLMRRVYREVGKLLGCDPDPDLVEEARRLEYNADPPRYIRRLLVEAGYEWMIVDSGFPSKRIAGYDVDLEAFSSMLPCPMREVFRIEPLLDALLEDGAPFPNFINRYEEGIASALASEGVVALKSVIAYRTGLQIRIHSRWDASEAYERLRSGRSRTSDNKTIRDYCLASALDQAADRGVPLQLHAGAGDGPKFDLVSANPAHLAAFLAERRYRNATVVLVHAGYPFVEEAGWLASQYSGVYADISEMLPFAAHATRSKLLGLLEMAPMSKVLFGSDGVRAPEVHWFAALEGRAAVAFVASELLEMGWLTRGDAEVLIRRVLRENAADLYGLHG